MAKGIRTAVVAKFNALAQARLNGELGEIESGTLSVGNKALRAQVLAYATSTFNISTASACTAYNHAFQTAKKLTPELVVGLGRADDKKGGRKLGSKNPAKVVAEGEVQPAAEEVVVETVAVEVPAKKAVSKKVATAKAPAAKKAKKVATN